MAVRDSGARQDTWNVILTLAGHEFGLWDKKSGGEVDSDDTKYYPGGMKPPLSLGGRITPGNITLSRIYDRNDDDSAIQLLTRLAGKGNGTVSQRALDVDGNPVGSRTVWDCKLKRVTFPDVDSESSSAAMVEVELSVADRPTFQ